LVVNPSHTGRTSAAWLASPSITAAAAPSANAPHKAALFPCLTVPSSGPAGRTSSRNAIPPKLNAYPIKRRKYETDCTTRGKEASSPIGVFALISSGIGQDANAQAQHKPKPAAVKAL
jgi:hypothetical protein